MISIIIPTYNRPKLLKKAIESIVNQTYKNIEIIVVDDNSSMDNKVIIDSFDFPIIYFKFDKNQGGNACRNKGVELSRGEYIAFLDDDDVFHKNKIEKQISFMKQNNIELSYTGKNIIYIENDKILKKRYSFHFPCCKNLNKAIMKQNFIGSTSTIIVKKESFLDVDGFDMKMPALQDYEFYIRFIHSGFKVQGIDEALLDYFIFVEEKAVSKSLKKNLKATQLILKKYYKDDFFISLFISLSKITIKKILKV